MKRIITAREQVQMLAAWRRTAFDWKPSTSVHGGERYRAALENGHVLTIDNDPKHGWQWALFEPSGTMIGDDGIPVPVSDLRTGGGSRWKGIPGATATEHLPTREHAQSQAEDAYRRLYPIGTNTGGHDSGVDYDDFFRNLNDYL